jgi:hypothetical protein
MKINGIFLNLQIVTLRYVFNNILPEPMNQSNIFALMELHQLVEELTATSSEPRKKRLKSQSAYFRIIEPQHFSDDLVSEWEDILGILRYNGDTLNENGMVMYSRISTMMETLTEDQCQDIIDRVLKLHGKLVQEFKVA